MPIRHTDVLVVGGELAGAVTAALLARSARRVVVLLQGEGVDGEAMAGLRIPPVDDLCPNLELLPRALSALEALGLRQDLRRLLPIPSAALQVLDPDHRLDLFLDAQPRLADLRREAGAAGEKAALAMEEEDPELRAAVAALETVDPLVENGFFARRRARRTYKDAFANLPNPAVLNTGEQVQWLSQGLASTLPFLSHAQDVPSVVAQRLLRAMLGGVHVAPEGSRNVLREMMLNMARQRGAEVISDEPVAAMVVEGKKISEVRLGGRADALVARIVVDATRYRDLAERVSPEKHAKKLLAPTETVKPARVRAGVIWVVRNAGVVPGLGERGVLARTGDAPGEGAVLLGCERHPHSLEARRAVTGLSVITASTVVEPAQAAVAVEALEARLRRLFPYTRRHLVESRTLGSNPEQVARGAVYSGPPEPVALGGRGVAGGLKNLLRAGRDVVPALGVEGELWAGHAVATLAERVLAKRPWFGGHTEEAAVPAR